MKAAWTLLQPAVPTIILSAITAWLIVGQPQVRETLLVVGGGTRPGWSDIVLLAGSSVFLTFAIGSSIYMSLLEPNERAKEFAATKTAQVYATCLVAAVQSLPLLAIMIAFTGNAVRRQSEADGWVSVNAALVVVLHAALFVAIVWLWRRYPVRLPDDRDSEATGEQQKVKAQRFVRKAIIAALAVWVVLFALVFHPGMVRFVSTPALILLFIGCLCVVLNGFLLLLRWSEVFTPLGGFWIVAAWLFIVSLFPPIHGLREMTMGVPNSAAMLMTVASAAVLAFVAWTFLPVSDLSLAVRARRNTKTIGLIAVPALIVIALMATPHGIGFGAAADRASERAAERERVRVTERAAIDRHLMLWLRERMGDDPARPVPPVSPAPTPADPMSDKIALLQTVEVSTGQAPRVRDVETKATAGPAADKRIGRSPGRPYPLVIAAAQGGGIRAALWTSAVLAALHDRDPDFTCHLFAISGVSGGSVGALTFQAALDRKQSCTGDRPVTFDAPCRECGDKLLPFMRDMFSRDFLTPVVARLLFADTVLALWPFGVHDRQVALEAEFYRAFCDAKAKAKLTGRRGFDCATPAFFAEGFMDVVRPDPFRTNLPALFLVASDVVSGARYIASDLKIDRWTNYEAGDLLERRVVHYLEPSPRRDLPPLALPAWSAAGASARFPWISPPGTFEAAIEPLPREFLSESKGLPAGAEGPSLEGMWRTFEPQTVKLLDGGIAESSGALTLAEIANAINRACKPDLAAKVLECIISDVPGAAPRVCTEDVIPVSDARWTEARRKAAEACQRGERYFIRFGVLLIENAAWTYEAELDDDKSSGLGILMQPFEAILAPISAVASSRSGRGREALSRASGDTLLTVGGPRTEALLPSLDDAEDRDADDGEEVFVPNDCRSETPRSVPLGWMLAPATQRYVADCAEAYAAGRIGNLRNWWADLEGGYTIPPPPLGRAGRWDATVAR